MTEFSGEVHPLASVAPMLSEQELRELAESIRSVGLLNPIRLDKDGRLLDGRNRLAACALAEVEPSFVVDEGDPVDVILAAEDRRHMSPGQRAMWRAQVMAEAGLRDGGRWKRGSVERGGSPNSATWQDAMKRAGLVIDWRPDLVGAVIAGELALDKAHGDAKAEREKAKRMDELDADLAALVQAGTVELDDALARQSLPSEFRSRVNDGHITVEEARQLAREQDDRVSSVLDAVDQWRRGCERLEAARHSPEYPLAIDLLEPVVAKSLTKEFPHVK